MDKLKGIHKARKAESEAADNAIFDRVSEAFQGTTDQSGKETFEELSTWAKDNVSAEDRKEINALLRKGGLAAKLAIDSLVETFKASDSFISQPAELLQGDDTSSEYGGKPLDKIGYDRELRKLLGQGHDYDTSPEIASLNTRRMKAINRGK